LYRDPFDQALGDTLIERAQGCENVCTGVQRLADMIREETRGEMQVATDGKTHRD
jgi:hypothetical protein